MKTKEKDRMLRLLEEAQCRVNTVHGLLEEARKRRSALRADTVIVKILNLMDDLRQE